MGIKNGLKVVVLSMPIRDRTRAENNPKREVHVELHVSGSAPPCGARHARAARRAIDVAVTDCAGRSTATSCALRDATGAIRSRLTWHAEREVRVTVRVPLRVRWAAPSRVAGQRVRC
jgi:hypothetical protein